MAGPRDVQVRSNSSLNLGPHVEGLFVRGLSVARGGATVVKALTLHVALGEGVAITGPNGAGKTTALLAIAGLLPHQSGLVEWHDPNGTPRHDASGLLLQGGRVFRNLTVTENMSVASRQLRRPERDHRLQSLRQALPVLTSHAQRHARVLSGGERQCLALAMVLIQRPRLLLLDEPLAGTDSETAERIADLLVHTKKEWHAALLFVEHRAAFVTHCADRVIRLPASQHA